MTRAGGSSPESAATKPEPPGFPARVLPQEHRSIKATVLSLAVALIACDLAAEDIRARTARRDPGPAGAAAAEPGRAVSYPGSPGARLLIERIESSLGDVIAGEEKLESPAIVARVFAVGEWRLLATVSGPANGSEHLEWRTAKRAAFSKFVDGAAIEIASGTGDTAPAGELVTVDVRLTTAPTSHAGIAEFLIDLRLEQP